MDGDGYVECDEDLSEWVGPVEPVGYGDCSDDDATTNGSTGEICDGLFNDCAHPQKFQLRALLEIVSVPPQPVRFMTVTTLLNVSMRVEPRASQWITLTMPTQPLLYQTDWRITVTNWHNLFNHKGVMTLFECRS